MTATQKTAMQICPGADWNSAAGACETGLLACLSHASNTFGADDATRYAAGWVARNYHLAHHVAEIVMAAAMLGGQS